MVVTEVVGWALCGLGGAAEFRGACVDRGGQRREMHVQMTSLSRLYGGLVRILNTQDMQLRRNNGNSYRHVVRLQHYPPITCSLSKQVAERTARRLRP